MSELERLREIERLEQRRDRRLWIAIAAIWCAALVVLVIWGIE